MRWVGFGKYSMMGHWFGWETGRVAVFSQRKKQKNRSITGLKGVYLQGRREIMEAAALIFGTTSKDDPLWLGQGKGERERREER